MGMYDNGIPKELNQLVPICPFCKIEFNENNIEWQTKSYENCLFEVSLKEISKKRSEFEFHTICENCREYFSIHFEKDKLLLSYYDNKHSKRVYKDLPDYLFDLYKTISKE